MQADTKNVHGLAEQLQRIISSRAPGIYRWDISTCSICGAPYGYLFQGQLLDCPPAFSGACDCARGPLQVRTWPDVALQYIRTPAPAWWGFDEPTAPAEPQTYRQTYAHLPAYEKERAAREVWQQITDKVGSTNIWLGWAGMSPGYAITHHTSGEVLQVGPGPYHLSESDLQGLMCLVEHPPGPDERADDVDEELRADYGDY